MVYKKKKYHYGDTHLKRKWRTKRRTKDLDQIDEDLKPENAKTLLDQEVDLDKPGELSIIAYIALEIEPYTIEDSERAAGFGSWKTPNKRVIETQTPKVEENDSETDTPSKKMKIDA
ncbi:hypothetical protein NQ317_002868 [Molorchus minor]|uniref:Uncharacterized protein n=1 Tax=Molorchus minor TaxID=1323400 RepID=A0ABQ9J2S0_9CUCU|nr:hypothetical protein NQ317_002868 [Molorchus minor]